MENLSIREIQLESLKILKVVHNICIQEGLQYWLCYGTLLGAIRHNGFIPWDDDLDIQMPREDYEKFIDYCINHKEEIKPLELMHYRTNSKYIYPIARLSNSEFVANYKDTKNYGLGTFIDIYPLDGYNINDKKHLKSLDFKRKSITMMGLTHIIKSNNKIKNIFKSCIYFYLRKRSINNALKKIDVLAQKYDFNNSEYIGCTNWEMQTYMKKEYYSSSILHKFEDSEFFIPKYYHELLTNEYGDYMKLPPEHDRIGHHFYTISKK